MGKMSGMLMIANRGDVLVMQTERHILCGTKQAQDKTGFSVWTTP